MTEQGREKEVFIRIKDVQRGGFWRDGYVVITIVERVDGVEKEAGDHIGTPDVKYEFIAKMEGIRNEYEENGWTLKGDWDFR